MTFQYFALRVDLARAVPHGEPASSGYCLTNAGIEYLVYLPEGGEVTVNLPGGEGSFGAEWFDPTAGEAAGTLVVPADGARVLTAPLAGDAAPYVYRDGGEAG